MASASIEPTQLTSATFIPERTRSLLEDASRAIGLDPVGAELLRHHTNAVYRLTSAPVVVKIGRPGNAHAVDVVSLVRWLDGRGVPTVPLWEIEQPLHLAGCDITLWRYLPQTTVSIAAGDLAGPLAVLHAQPEYPAISLPERHLVRALKTISRSIDHSSILSPDDKQLLRTRRRALEAQLPEVTFDLPLSLIHGDAHHRNTLWDARRCGAVLCDWDSAAIGQPEWDLVTVEVHCRRFGHPADEHDAFVRWYGIDIRDWNGYAWLRDVRELRMITTNARKSVPGSANADEVLRRVEALRENVAIEWRIM